MIDRVILNANIYTQNPKQPHASALAIIGERIVAVGNDDAIRSLAGPSTQIDNLNGRFLIPGLTDAHMHWEGLSKALQAVDLTGIPSRAEAVARIGERTQLVSEGEWIFGRGWRTDSWADHAFPTAAELDVATPNNPVYLISKSGHAAWVNSLALKIAGVDANTPNPAGGSFQRAADGSLTGVLLEWPAMRQVSERIPTPTAYQLAEWMFDAQDFALSKGLTGFHDFDDPSCMKSLQILREQGNLNLRVVKQINVDWIEHAHELGIHSGFGDDWIRFGGLKIFADGALGPQTALMIEPYENDPQNYGIAVTDKEEMYELVSRASAMGMASTIHAIGDKAVHDVLDVYETVRREEQERGSQQRPTRHRIEHVQIIHPSDVGRLAELDVIASMQPIHATSDYEMADRYWGERAAFSYAWRKQENAGAVLAFGSDAPIETPDPLQGIYAALTRRRANGKPGLEGWYPEERLSLESTLTAYTKGPAFAAEMDNRLGMLAPNYLADMVVLDRDLFGETPEAILETGVLGTMVGGTWRFRIFE